MISKRRGSSRVPDHLRKCGFHPPSVFVRRPEAHIRAGDADPGKGMAGRVHEGGGITARCTTPRSVKGVNRIGGPHERAYPPGGSASRLCQGGASRYKTADALIGGLTLVTGRLLVLVCLVQVGPHLHRCAIFHLKLGTQRRVRFPAVVLLAGQSALGLKTNAWQPGRRMPNRTAGTMGT
jgi:hypothetical protein